MMRPYLLEIKHQFGESHVHTRQVIRAKSRQYVKYWYHNHYKQWGHTPAWATNKHTVNISSGHIVEIEQIKELDEMEYDVLKEYLTSFPKE